MTRGNRTRRDLNTNDILLRLPAPALAVPRAPHAFPPIMSRGLTSAQVVELGEYLKPDFDPSTLTISQLRGVLNHHNINFPSSQTKPKLVQVFNEEIKPKAKKFTKERIKRENSNASEDGIIDGVTGRPLNEGRQVRALPLICASPSATYLSAHSSKSDVPDASPRPPPPRRFLSQSPVRL